MALSGPRQATTGATGTATTYDVRYSTSTITAGNWASATQATGEPAPSVAGSAETFTVTGLSESTTYFFAIKTSDEEPNESGLSNVPSTATATTAPDAVTDLATGTVTASSVALSWTAPGDDGATGTATTYDVRYSTSTINAGNWASATQATGEPAPSVAGSAETFTVTLSESTTYFFAIKTSDEAPNESALSNVPSAATATTAPDAVTDLATGTVTSSSIDLSWTAPGDDGATGTATTYDVRYSTSTITAGNWASATQATGEPAPSVAGSAETLTVTGLSESTTYYFAIKTSDEVPNESAISNVPSSATATTAPADVTDLATGTVTTSSVDLSWTAPGDDGATGTATTYDVRYSTSTITAGNWASATQATGEPAPSVAGSAETLTVTGLSESTTYYFAIKTSDEVPNESAISNVPNATTADGTAPADVTALATGTVTTSSVALSWTAPGDDGATGTATTYDMRYSTSTITAGNWATATQATGEPAPSVAGSAETFTVTGLSESTTYYFAIKTSDEEPNESGLSNVPSAATATTAPADVTDLATGTVTTSSVDLSWTAPGDDGATGTATTYDVRYSTGTITAGNWATATQATGEPSPSVAGSAETFTVTGLSLATTYYFAIKTSDEVPNESAISNVPSSATAADGAAPADVTDLATGTVTASSVALSWTAPGDDGATGTATTYDVRYSTSTITAGNWASATQASGEPAPSVAGSAESFTVTGLSGGTTYYFAIKTSDEEPNESGLSNVPSAATARTLALPLYLEGDAVTTASLTATPPSQSSLPNYDPGRNSDAGLLLNKSSLGLVSETGANNYQIWVDAAGPLEINGPVVLGFWSAVVSFPTDKRGIVDAGLFECDTDGTNCSVIVQGSLDQTPWSSSGTWASYNIDFGTVSHTVQAGKALAVKVTIGDSGEDMWLAYWTTAYPGPAGYVRPGVYGAGRCHRPGDPHGDNVLHRPVVDGARRRRRDGDRDDLRRALFDEHDHRGQLGVGHAGDGRAFPVRGGQRRDVHGHGAEREHDVLLRDQDLGRAAQRERALERAERRDSDYATGRRRGPGDGHADGYERRAVVDRSRRRRRDGDRDDLRRPLLDEHDHGGQLGDGDAGDG